MARLRYMSNARTGDAKTVCKGDLTITGDLVVVGGYTLNTEIVPLNQNLQGSLIVGRNDTGFDVKFYGDGSGYYWLWDEDQDTNGGVKLVGTTSHTGIFTMEGTSKLHFHDTDGEYIYASGDNALAIHSGSTITLTASEVAIVGEMTSTEKITIAPTAALTAYLDLALETHCTQGTLINVGYGSGSTTLAGDIVGVFINFNERVTPASGHDLTGYKVEFAGFTENATEVNFIGFDLPIADAIDVNGGGAIFKWKGVNLKLPDMNETGSGTTTVYGVYIAAGSNSSGDEYGVYITGTDTGVYITGGCVTGINLTGAYSSNAIAIETIPAATMNGVYSHLTASSAWDADNICAFRGRVAISTTTGVSSATAVWAGINITSNYNGNGLVCAINAEISSTTSTCPNAIVYIQSLPDTSADFSDIPYLVFSETANGIGSNILFEVGHLHANTAPTNEVGTLFWKDTLQIAVNATAGTRTAYFIPLSTVQGTFTTAYPISVAVAGGIAITVGTSTTGIDISGDLTTAILIDGASDGTSIDIDRDMNFDTATGIGDNYPAAIKIDLEQTADTGTGLYDAQGGMYGLNSRLHVAYANTGAYCVLGRAYITATDAGDFVNDVVGVMGELRIDGVDTRYGDSKSSLSALRGDISNLSTGAWNGQVYTLFLNYGSGKNYGLETAFIHAYNHGDSYLDYGIHLCQNSTAQAMTTGIWLDIKSSTTVTTGIYLDNSDGGTLTTGISIDACATANIAITQTASGAGVNGIIVNSTFTSSAAEAYKAIESNVTYTPGDSGTGVPIAIAGKVILSANQTHSGLYMWGIQGGLYFSGGSTLNSSQVAAGRFVLEETGAVNYTGGSIAGVYIDNLISSDLDGMTGQSSLIRLANHGGVIDNAIEVYSSKITNLFNIVGVNACFVSVVNANTTHSGDCRQLKLVIDETPYYLIVSTETTTT